MKNVVIAAGIAGLIYYFFFYSKPLNPASIPSTTNPTNGAGTLNNPHMTAGHGNAINLGASFAQRVPGVASVS